MNKLSISFLLFILFFLSFVYAQSNSEDTKFDSLISLAEEFETQNDFLSAIQIYNKAYRLGSSSLVALKIAQLYFKESKCTESLVWTEKRLIEDSNDINALYFKIMCLNNLDKYKEVISPCNQFLKLTETRNDVVYYARGIANFNLDNYEEAYSDLYKCLMIEPEYYDAYMPFGAVGVELLLLDEGRYFLNKSIDNNIKVPESYYHLGRSYFIESNYQEALKNYILSADQYQVNYNECDETCISLLVDIAELAIALEEESVTFSTLNKLKVLRENFNPEEFKDYINLYLYIKKYSEALELTLEANKSFPDHSQFYGLNLYTQSKIKGSIKDVFPKNLIDDFEFCDADCQLMALILTAYGLYDYKTAIEGIEMSYKMGISSDLPTYVHLLILREDPVKNQKKVLELYDDLIGYFNDNIKKKAYFKAMKSIDLNALGNNYDALKEVNEAIQLHGYAEYYILKIIAKIIVQGDEHFNDVSFKNKLLESFDKALELDPANFEFYRLKSLVLKYLHFDEEACLAAKESKNVDEGKGELLFNYVCKGIEPDEQHLFSLDLEFGLTDYSIRFPNGSDDPPR